MNDIEVRELYNQVQAMEVRLKHMENTIVTDEEKDEEEEEGREENEDDYEDELEYVEIKSSVEEINNRKKLYMDNDDSDQIENQNSVNQIDEKNNIDFKQKKQSTTNLASKRPIQNATETLDIEPLDEQNLVQDNKNLEKFEIDDPW